MNPLLRLAWACVDFPLMAALQCSMLRGEVLSWPQALKEHRRQRRVA